MAVLADANSSFTGSSGTAIYNAPTARNNAQSQSKNRTSNPPPGGQLIIQTPSGGLRG